MLLELLAGGHTLVLSGSVLDEVERVIYYPRLVKRFGLTEIEITEFVAFLAASADIVKVDETRPGGPRCSSRHRHPANGQRTCGTLKKDEEDRFINQASSSRCGSPSERDGWPGQRAARIQLRPNAGGDCYAAGPRVGNRGRRGRHRFHAAGAHGSSDSARTGAQRTWTPSGSLSFCPARPRI